LDSDYDREKDQVLDLEKDPVLDREKDQVLDSDYDRITIGEGSGVGSGEGSGVGEPAAVVVVHVGSCDCIASTKVVMTLIDCALNPPASSMLGSITYWPFPDT
jgi:hypothetical protein